MEPMLTINYISIADGLCFVLLFGTSIGCYRINGVFGRRFAILLFFLAIEILFAGYAVTLDRSNMWYSIIKISGRVIELIVIIWFLFFITDKKKEI